MILVLGLVAIVFAAVGALIGGLLAHYLPRAFLFGFWAMLFVGALYLFTEGRTSDEFERAGTSIQLFAVAKPLLLGSLTAGILVRRRKRSHHNDA